MDDENETQNQESPGRPVARFTGSGGLQLAVWKHKSDSGRTSYSVLMERNYKDADDQYRSTTYLRDGDLLRAEAAYSSR